MERKKWTGKMMNCCRPGKQAVEDESDHSSSGNDAESGNDAQSGNDAASVHSSQRSGAAVSRTNSDILNDVVIEPLRESNSLTLAEGRALMAKLEYEKGNVRNAFFVLKELDFRRDIMPNLKLVIAGNIDEPRKSYSPSELIRPMSMFSVGLLTEAMLLKSTSLQHIGRFKDAAQTCNDLLETFESALPEGLPENFGTEHKLKETLNKAITLLPELWKLAGVPHQVILSYRRALLYNWNLSVRTTARIQKEFAILLLYSGWNASNPDLGAQFSHIDGSFVPGNNIEEAVLLLMVLLRKYVRKEIEWDPSIMDHLSFALSVSGGLRALVENYEELLPGPIDRKEIYYILALCYHGMREDTIALNMLRQLLSSGENPNTMPGLLLASKICGEDPTCAEQGVGFARRALDLLQGGCKEMGIVVHCLLGISISAEARSVVSDSEKLMKESEALEALETAERRMKKRDPEILFHLSLENAEQRKLDVALHYAQELMKLEGYSNVKGFFLWARILSAQKRYQDAEEVISTALDQTEMRDQGYLLRTKAKLQIAQGQWNNAVETLTHLLSVLKVKRGNHDSSLEVETWHDLAKVYTSLSQWQDVENCLSKSEAISPSTASCCHAKGLLYEAQGLHKEALEAFTNALEIDPTHVASLVSKAVVLRQLGDQPFSLVRGFLKDAVRLDRNNVSAWHNLGLIYQSEGGAWTQEAANCFQTAAHLSDSAPVEPFR